MHHFTPNDCATLWEYIEENFDEDLIGKIKRGDVVISTLDDCLEYEKIPKKIN